MKLSYRDQVILIVVIIAVILVGGFFLFIKPKIQDVENSQASLEQVQQQKEQVDAKIASAEMLTEKIKKLYEEDKKLEEFFLPEMMPHEIDQYISEYIIKHHLIIDGISVSPMSANELADYEYIPEELTYGLKESADINNNAAAPAKNNQQKKGEQLAMSTVSISYRGKIDDVRAFIEEIRTLDKAVIIDSFDMNTLTPTMEGEEITGSASIKIYGLARLAEPKV